MKAKIEKGVLTIELSEIVDALSRKDRKELARQLVADEELFAAVLECVADDSRWGHYFSDDEDGLWSFDPRTVLTLREKLLPLMSTVARNAVHEALTQRNDAREEARRMSEWGWKLFHAWPESVWNQRPATYEITRAPGVADSELPTAESLK